MKIKSALENMQKAQLQTYFQHWCRKAGRERNNDQLISRLQSVMTDAAAINRHYDMLRAGEKRFLKGLLMLKSQTGSVRDVCSRPPANRIEHYELESILRRLKERGFLLKAKRRNGQSRQSDLFTVPAEMAAILRASVVLEQRGAGQFLSLKEALKNGQSASSRQLAELVAPEALKQRINGLEDTVLRTVVWDAIQDHGGVFRIREWERGENGGSAINKTVWREALEAKQLGTVGVLNLKPFGIGLEENALCVYQEIVKAFSLDRACRGVPDNDKELSVGADLIIDLSRLSQIMLLEPVELTREGFFYKRKEARLKAQFVLAPHEDLFEGQLFKHLVALGLQLGLVEKSGKRLCTQADGLSAWEETSVVDRTKKILGLFLEERGRDHYSFHQKFLRLILIERLTHAKPGQWLCAAALIRSVVATFLMSMGKLKVHTYFKEKTQRNAGNEALLVPLERLAFDLSYWVLHRLALSGIVDVGYRKGHINALALSTLGAAVLSKQGGSAESTSALLVNPDYELLHFPEGSAYAEDALFINSFAERTGSERVKRYRLTRESIKRFVLSGGSTQRIIDFLAKRAMKKVPDNIVYALKEWAEGVELIHRRRAVVLQSETADGMDRIVQVLRDAKLTFQRVKPTMVLLPEKMSGKAFEGCRQRLREEGLHID